MHIICGNQLYGRVDKIPGLFSVATKFFHLYYVPLIPFESWLIIDGTETAEGFQGRKISLSGKSILLAWMRAAAVVCSIGAVFWGLIAVADMNKKGVTSPVSAALLLVSSLFMYWVSTRLGRPNFARSVLLAEELGLPAELIHQFFQTEDTAYVDSADDLRDRRRDAAEIVEFDD